MAPRRPHCIGLALGSGAARGWAHIGVINALADAGIEPQVVAGASIGAVVGAAFAAGKLAPYEEWVRQLDRRKVISYFDFSLRGGLIKAVRVFEFLRAQLPEQMIETMPRAFAAVATDLYTGDEVWLREGLLIDALRASGAIPGMVKPVYLDGRWMVDGGLINPVPVSLCRALGADFIIAVDLNTVLLPRRFRQTVSAPPPEARAETEAAAEVAAEAELAAQDGRWQAMMRSLSVDLRQMWRTEPAVESQTPPSILEVLASSIDIMQMRITRSRIAGDPPELLIAPQLPDFGMLDFDRAAEAIEEGRRATRLALASLPRGIIDSPVDEVAAGKSSK